MTLETFFEKFEQFADAPNAVAKMRELVLDLAVKGKLTDRDAKNESVDSEYLDEPSSKALPANWRLLNFGKFCDIQGGNQPPKSQFSDEPRPGYVRMFQIRDLGERPVPVYISKESTNRFCSEGEILIGRYGASVGKVFWAQDGAYNVALAKFVFPEDAILPGFAFWVLKSDFFQAEIAGASRSAQAGFNKGDLAAIDFPLPPLAEQKRIVAKVDELMSLCDRLEAQQQERELKHTALARASLSRFADAPTPANLNFLFHKSYTIPPADLRKSILTLAVQGKLVPQDPNDEPVSALLERLISLTAAGGQVPKSLRPIDTDALPFELPFAWEWVQAQDLCRPASLITYGVLKPVWVDVGVPTVRVQDMQDGMIVVSGVGQCASERAAKFGKTTLEAGDLLIAKDGATLGKTAFVPASLAGGNITQHVLRFPMTPHVDALFIRLVIDAPHGQAWMRSETKGVALPGVNVGDFRRMPVPLPPLAEQRRIVAKVDQLMSLVGQLENQLTASRATAEKLMESFVAELTTT